MFLNNSRLHATILKIPRAPCSPLDKKAEACSAFSVAAVTKQTIMRPFRSARYLTGETMNDCQLLPLACLTMPRVLVAKPTLPDEQTVPFASHLTRGWSLRCLLSCSGHKTNKSNVLFVVFFWDLNLYFEASIWIKVCFLLCHLDLFLNLLHSDWTYLTETVKFCLGKMPSETNRDHCERIGSLWKGSCTWKLQSKGCMDGRVAFDPKKMLALDPPGIFLTISLISAFCLSISSSDAGNRNCKLSDRCWSTGISNR